MEYGKSASRLENKPQAGAIIDPAHVYFRTVPTFETGSEAYRWLHDRFFIGSAERTPDCVRLDIYEVQ
ncbi:DUF3237 family protein [Bacillus subtilis]|nr:DUF3237 family protein [Bacillus subtilis]